MAHTHQALARDELRAQVYLSLIEAAKLHGAAEADQIEYYLNPTELRAKCNIAKGEMTLLPVAGLRKFSVNKAGTTNSSNSLSLTSAPAPP